MADDTKIIKADIFVTNWNSFIEKLKLLKEPKNKGVEEKFDNLVKLLEVSLTEIQLTLDLLIKTVKTSNQTLIVGKSGSGAGFAPNMDNWDVRVMTLSTINTGSSLPLFFIPAGFTLVVRARNANTGNVFVSNSIANAQGTNRITLAAGEAVKIAISRSDRIFIAVSVANEGIEYFWEK